MAKRIAAKITALAGYVPPRLVTNFDLAKRVDTNDEWIRTRTGIIERHYADPGVATSHLGTEAAKKALAMRGITWQRFRRNRAKRPDILRNGVNLANVQLPRARHFRLDPVGNYFP